MSAAHHLRTVDGQVHRFPECDVVAKQRPGCIEHERGRVPPTRPEELSPVDPVALGEHVSNGARNLDSEHIRLSPLDRPDAVVEVAADRYDDAVDPMWATPVVVAVPLEHEQLVRVVTRGVVRARAEHQVDTGWVHRETERHRTGKRHGQAHHQIAARLRQRDPEPAAGRDDLLHV